MEVWTLRLGRRKQALLDEIRMAAFVSDSELCLVAVKELLNLWERTPEYPLPGKPVGRVMLAGRIREMARRKIPGGRGVPEGTGILPVAGITSRRT